MSSISLKLPITHDDGDGFTMIKTIRQMVKQNLKMLILTIPGERIMEPNFGVGLSTYLFSNYNEGVNSSIKSKILQQVQIYLPAIRIVNVTFENFIETNSLKVIIRYSIPDVNVNDLLEITI